MALHPPGMFYSSGKPMESGALKVLDVSLYRRGQLITTLLELIEHGTGAAAYYADIMEAVVSMAILAPCGPPTGSWVSSASVAASHAPDSGHRRAGCG